MAEKITSKQIITLMAISRIAITISIMPTINIRPYNQDTWIIILLSILYTHLFMVPLLFLANKFKDTCMIGYLQRIYGVTIGKVLGFLYGVFFIVQSIDGASTQAELLATSILADTSQGLILLCMMITCVYCASKGIEAGLRAAEIFGPIVVFIIISLMILGIGNLDYRLLLPIFADSSILDINLGAMELSLYYVEIFILAMFIPYLENKEDINKIFTKAIIYTLGLLSIVIVVCQITLGVEYMRYSNFPFMHFARSIRIFEAFERIDLVAVIAWVITSIFRLWTFLILSATAFGVIFNNNINKNHKNNKNHKANKDKVILIVIGVIVSILTFYILNKTSVIVFREYIDKFLSLLLILFAIILPSITCIVYFIRKKSIEGKKHI